MTVLSLRNFYVKTNVDIDAIKDAGNVLDMDTDGEVRRVRLIGFSNDRPERVDDVTWAYAVTDEDDLIALPLDGEEADKEEMLQKLMGDGSATRYPDVFNFLLGLNEEYFLDEALGDGLNSSIDTPDDVGVGSNMSAGYSIEVGEDALEDCWADTFIACYTNMIVLDLDDDSDYLIEGDWQLNPETMLDCLDDVEGNGEMVDEFESIAYAVAAPAFA